RAERTERRRPAGGVAHIELVQVGGGSARILVSLQRDPEGMAEQVEVVHVERAQIDLQGVEDVRQAQAQELGLGPVEIVIELRRRSGEGREERLRVELRPFARRGDQRLGRVIERDAALAREILDFELEAASCAKTVDRW